MIVVYLDRKGHRQVAHKTKSKAWRTKMNVIASFTSMHEYEQSDLYKDMRTYKHR